MTDFAADMNALEVLMDLHGNFPYGQNLNNNNTNNNNHNNHNLTARYLDTATSSESTSPIMPSFGMSIITDLTATSNMYPSPTSSTGDVSSPQPTIKEEKPVDSASKPPAKRKRENRYKNAPPSVLSRRRAQNRASQRAYRERKDQRIKDLEGMLDEYKRKNDTLSEAYSTLHTEYHKLRSGLSEPQRHHSISIPFDASSVGLRGTGPVGMGIPGGWHVFQEMPTYSI